ncbi:universal stress protein [Desulfonatronum thiodismutans]|uniref:universal stress protein n=1 Tax=Desulfonatronum thiodismutans TaxID=159290 RepID=UPI0004ABE42D|nr:universal stress protein [Desulfonatronum thiodismutans]
MFKLVLLALTDKGDGTSAFRLAAAVAVRHKSGFMVQHVSTPQEREKSCVLQLSNERELSTRRVEVEAFCRANMPEGLTADVVLSSGFVHVETLKTIRLMEPDLVVLGDQGDAEHCRRELSASTTDTALLIAREAACPVLTVPSGMSAALSRSFPGTFQRIVAATDLQEGTEDVLTMAGRVLKADAGALAVFHALPLAGTALEGTALNQALSQARSRLGYLGRDLGRDLSLSTEATYVVREGDPSVEILKYARDSEADLIVLTPDCYAGTREPSEKEPCVSSQVLAGARCPVMLVGPDAPARRFQKPRQPERKT